MRKMLAGCLVALALLGLVSGALADETYPTNLELVEQAVRAAVDSMDLAPPGIEKSHLKIDAGSGAEAAWLLNNVLKQRLLALGWQIRAQAEAAQDSGADDGFLLELRITDLGVNYGRSWRRFLLVGKVVERIARVSMYYELVERSSGQVLVSSHARSEIRDHVPASMLAALSNSEYGFASPELAKGQWDRYLEGGLVIAIIGVLIYLFYSNKTAS